MTRALAFIALRLTELVAATFSPLAPSLALGILWLLDPITEALRPRGFVGWENMDLREAYPVSPYGDWWEDPS